MSVWNCDLKPPTWNNNMAANVNSYSSLAAHNYSLHDEHAHNGNANRLIMFNLVSAEHHIVI